MAIFEDSKTKKKSFHMNPQAGKALHAGPGKVGKPAPPHQAEHGQPEGGEHQHVGLAHHVEVHHGGHPQGHPPMHEGHTHHTIHHPHDGGEPTIHNHENYDEAEHSTRAAMTGEEGGNETMEPGQEVAEGGDVEGGQVDYGE